MTNILELTKRAVDLEGLGELLHSSRVSVELVIVIEVATNGVALEAATESRIDASKATDSCQIGQVCGRVVAYLSSTSVVLILRASETCFAPSAPSPLNSILQTRRE